MTDNEDYSEINEEANSAISDILGSDIIIISKPDDTESIKLKKLIVIVNTIEQGIARRTLQRLEMGMDFTVYDDLYENSLFALALLEFGEDSLQWIDFYVYDRMDEDTGEPRYLEDQFGNHYYLNTPQDLWNLIKHTTDQTTRKKKRKPKKNS